MRACVGVHACVGVWVRACVGVCTVSQPADKDTGCNLQQLISDNLFPPVMKFNLAMPSWQYQVGIAFRLNLAAQVDPGA